MRKWLIIILLIVLTYIGYNYLYQEHRDIANEQAFFATTSALFLEEFSNDSELTQSKYLNETIEINGKVSDYTNKTITLDSRIYCIMGHTINPAVTVGENITLKGRLIGYDDLLEEIKLDQCLIIN